ncbi:hypothetical protein [Mesonia sp. HuA40]|uniref:hypothetical protein n=1 Tax=Mesonia sp. HuA40 TaxID=2602761 RepID=UPI0011C9897D|nr:hypothetical protein [Mesonia sp. HuA40]TXK73660.1 hypothetical protein FT993_04935 [Mesonia sp. HuA40]
MKQLCHQSITYSSILQANTINEYAICNWYDENENLLHSREQPKLKNAIAQTYKLEILATVDGYKYYANVSSKSPYQFRKYKF